MSEETLELLYKQNDENKTWWFEDSEGNKMSPSFHLHTYDIVEGDTFLQDKGLT